MQRGLWSWNQSPQGDERMHVLERGESVGIDQMQLQAECVA